MHFKTGQLLVLVILSSIPGQIYMDSTRTCKGGWASFQWSCYYFSTSKVSLKDAMSACHRMGAEVLELHNFKEERWIDLQIRLKGYMYGAIWLGASDVQHEGTFLYLSNAEPMFYSTFSSGEPNNLNNIEHCVIYTIQQRGMLDRVCNERHNYVCKMQK